MKAWFGWIGASVGGAIGWWLGAYVGVMTAFFVSMLGTGIGLCGANTAPAACTRFRDIPFTAHNFPSPIVVLAGQIIQVTVVISFS